MVAMVHRYGGVDTARQRVLGDVEKACVLLHRGCYKREKTHMGRYSIAVTIVNYGTLSFRMLLY
jgi:hypothetical protein